MQRNLVIVYYGFSSFPISTLELKFDFVSVYHKVQPLLENGGGGAYSVPVRVDATRKLVVE